MLIELPVDLNDVEMNDFSAVPPGTYSLQVMGVEQRLGKTSQKPYLNMTYKIVDDPEYSGRQIFDMISLDPKALFRLKGLALATGLEINTSFDSEDLLGLEFAAVVDVEAAKADPITGKSYDAKNKVKSFIIPE